MEMYVFLQEQKCTLYVMGALIFAMILWAAGKTRQGRKYRKSEYWMETKKRRKKVEKDKGSAGEYETSISLEKIKGKKYFVFNAYIPKAGGKGCVETDIIMIHEKGVVVIENKNYSGVVKGRADRTYWEQILNGRRYTFYSPVYQNMNHIRHIKAFLENRGAASPSLPVFSAVVFNDKIRRLKIKRKWKSEAIICRSRKAPAKIQKKLRHGERALDEREMEELYRELKSRSEVFRWVKRSHRKKVEKYKKNLD